MINEILAKMKNGLKNNFVNGKYAKDIVPKVDNPVPQPETDDYDDYDDDDDEENDDEFNSS